MDPDPTFEAITDLDPAKKFRIRGDPDPKHRVSNVYRTWHCQLVLHFFSSFWQRIVVVQVQGGVDGLHKAIPTPVRAYEVVHPLRR
jgi:hypothetical protein